MQEHGFPPYLVHKAEHDRVLLWLEYLYAAVEAVRARGDVEQAILHDIPAWLLQHVQSMDMVTARFLAQRTGGAA